MKGLRKLALGAWLLTSWTTVSKGETCLTPGACLKVERERTKLLEDKRKVLQSYCQQPDLKTKTDLSLLALKMYVSNNPLFQEIESTFRQSNTNEIELDGGTTLRREQWIKLQAARNYLKCLARFGSENEELCQLSR